MSVEHYKSEGDDFFDEMQEDSKKESKKNNLANKDTINNIEKKLKDSKKEEDVKELSNDSKKEEEDVKEVSNDSYKEKKKDLSNKDPNEIIKEAKNTLTEQEKELHNVLEKDIGKIEMSSKEKESKNKEELKKESSENKDSNENKDSKDLEIKPKLKFLEDPEDSNTVYIGRKKSVLKQYGKMGSAHIGKVAEKDNEGRMVRLDGLNPHVVFLDGARGTGKSYLLGVIAEQLAKNNPYIGQLVIDPVGVFWSMKYPNRDKKELEILKQWGLEPEGLDNLKIFVPEGLRDQVSEETFDDTFSMYPSLLLIEDWCITFGIDRFSPGGLLLEKTLDFVKKGYTAGGTKDNPNTEKIDPKGNQFTLEDIIYCLQNNSEFYSSSKGYKPDSIRALVSRFEAAKSWGIFSDHGTPLSKLSRENQLTILDTSFLDENITALVIGILARRILSARKLLARQDAVKKFSKKELDPEQMLEIEIPPTWMYIDEAHTLIPSGNTLTPATAGIIEYVKQGRRPGCSLVFATQQPSAINSKVLSQVDVLISNKLVFNDDIHAIKKRMPAIIPKQYKEPNFIKTLPFATALCGERSEETSRAFLLRAAPRASQHEGRDAETIRDVPKKSKADIISLASEMIYKKLDRAKHLRVQYGKDILDVINIKYKSNVFFDEVLEKLKEKGVIEHKEKLYLDEKEVSRQDRKVQDHINLLEKRNNKIDSGEDSENVLEEDQEDSQEESQEAESHFEEIEKEIENKQTRPSRVPIHSTLPLRINRYSAEQIVRSNIKKSLLFFKPKEIISTIVLKYRPIYKVVYNIYNDNDTFKRTHCYIDSVTGEFMHFKNSKFKESVGFNKLDQLNHDDLEALYLLKNQQTLFNLSKELEMDEAEVQSKYINKFDELKIIDSWNKNNRDLFKLSDNFDVPFNASHKLLTSLDELPLKKEETDFVEKTEYSTSQIQENLEKLWGELEFISLEEIYWPIWYATLINKDDETRVLKIDAVVGEILK